MKIPTSLILRAGLTCLSSMVATTMAQGSIPQTYCSNENTGSGDFALNSIYMSMGKCFDLCNPNYAFAVVQYKNCWCSNYIPADQQSLGDCNQQCPGYPGDLCGNANSGLFGYIPTDNSPSGTAGAQSSTSSSSSSPTSQQPVSSDSSSAPISSSYIVSSSSSSITPSPRTTVKVITQSGSAVTQTVTQTPIVIGSGAPSSPDQVQVQRHPLSAGAIAGIVVGSLIGLAAIFLAAFLVWRRKKHADSGQAAGNGTTRPKRNISVLSKTGLLGRNRPQSMSENHNYDDDNLYGPGGNSVRHSMMFGAGATVEGVSPASPLGGSQENVNSSSRRHSKPLVYDQRLNPSALFANQEANGSRVSIQDQNDYSRPLGVANPDFRASFDSR